MKSIIKRIVGFGGVSLIAAFSSQVYASGYRLEFQSPSVLADAGDAAVVEDVGTNWYNSAGLVRLPRQIAVAGTYVTQRTNFKGQSIAPSFLPDNTFFGSGSVTSHPSVVLPAYHVGFPLNRCWALGFSFVPSWGLMENYGDTSFVRYNLVKIYTRTIDLAPSISWRINRWFSVGGGPDFDYWTVQQKRNVNTAGITLSDSRQRISAQSWAYGAHFGLLFQYDDCTRFGINYRSRITHNLKGYSEFEVGDDLLKFETHRFHVTLPHPATTAFSFYRDMTPRWSLMGTLTYDQWGSLMNLHGKNFILPPSVLNPTGLVNITIPQNYHNTIDLGLGIHIRANCNWLLRASVKWLQSPVPTKTRDINFPDGRKLGINLGARYQLTNAVAMDMIVAHVFTSRVNYRNLAPVSNVYTKGHTTTGINLVGAQLVFDV